MAATREHVLMTGFIRVIPKGVEQSRPVELVLAVVALRVLVALGLLVPECI